MSAGVSRSLAEGIEAIVHSDTESSADVERGEPRPVNPEGVESGKRAVSPDGKGWAYSVLRNLSELYLVEGVK